MAKKMKSLKIDPQPNFLPGTQVQGPMLIVDQNCVAWWVDPNDRSITKVA